jgi:hypothetical protein
MEERDNLPVIIGAVTAVLAAALLYAGRHEETPASAPTIAAQVPVPSQPEKSSLPTGYAIHQRPQNRQVYECTHDGKRLFSDSPCGENAQIRTLSPTNVMDAHQPLYQSDPSLGVMMRRTAGQDDADTHGRDCSGYEDVVKRIDARMRVGYTSSEGEFWRQRRHDAASARDDCKRDNRLR